MRDSYTDDLFTITGVNVDIVQLCQQQRSVYASMKKTWITCYKTSTLLYALPAMRDSKCMFECVGFASCLFLTRTRVWER